PATRVRGRSVRSECLASFKQCFQAGEDARPSVGAKCVGRIPFIPLIVADGELCGLSLWLKFRSHSRFERTLPKLKSVLEHCRRVLIVLLNRMLFPIPSADK